MKGTFKPVAQAWQAVSAGAPPHCSPHGWRAFQAGLLLIPSSALLSGLLLLGSISLWAPRRQPKPMSRAIARLLTGLAVLMALTLAAGSPGQSLEHQLRLMNWLPFFWFFLAIGPYLDTEASRSRAALAITAGSLPIALISLGQAAFGLIGPWQTLYGLIEWTLPAFHRYYGAGVFPNPNFNAAWMAMSLPLAAVLCLRAQAQANGPGSRLQSALAWVVLLSLATSLYINSSRTALLAGAIGLLALSWRAFLKPVSVVVTMAAAALALASYPANLPPWLTPLKQLALWSSGKLPRKVGTMVSANATSANLRSNYYPRIIEFIRAHPWGGKSEWLLQQEGSQVLEQAASLKPAGVAHFHSLPLQFAFDHGIPALILLSSIAAIIVIKAGRALKQSKPSDSVGDHSVDKAMLIAACIAIFLHTFDIPSFESRINLLGWILLAACWRLGSIPKPTQRQTVEPA